MCRSVSLTTIIGCVAVLLPAVAAPVPKGSEKEAVSRWEHKAVSFGADEKEGTKKLNDLARDGWEYVGPLGNGLVAFKRFVRSAVDIERDKFQGTWVLVSREEGGQVTQAADDTTTFTVSADKWVWKSGDAVITEGTFKLTDITKKPKQWEYAVTGGVVGYSIYEIDGDTFRYCSTGSAETRPTAFNTTDGGGLYCCVWKRAKK